MTNSFFEVPKRVNSKWINEYLSTYAVTFVLPFELKDTHPVTRKPADKVLVGLNYKHGDSAEACVWEGVDSFFEKTGIKDEFIKIAYLNHSFVTPIYTRYVRKREILSFQDLTSEELTEYSIKAPAMRMHIKNYGENRFSETIIYDTAKNFYNSQFKTLKEKKDA